MFIIVLFYFGKFYILKNLNNIYLNNFFNNKIYCFNNKLQVMKWTFGNTKHLKLAKYLLRSRI